MMDKMINNIMRMIKINSNSKMKKIKNTCQKINKKNNKVTYKIIIQVLNINHSNKENGNGQNH